MGNQRRMQVSGALCQPSAHRRGGWQGLTWVAGVNLGGLYPVPQRLPEGPMDPQLQGLPTTLPKPAAPTDDHGNQRPPSASGERATLPCRLAFNLTSLSQIEILKAACTNYKR